jgi:hypothetical protein
VEGSAPDTSDKLRMKVSEGTVSLCAIHNADNARAAATNDGNLSVRVIAFNSHDQILRNTVLPGGAQVDLPEGTAMAAVQSIGDFTSTTALAGWQRDTLFARTGRHSFLGDDCILRPQAGPIRREHGHVKARGLFDAARILDANRVRAQGVVSQGWIETILPAVPTVAISVAGSLDQAGEVRVRLAATDDPEHPRYGTDATPVRVEAADGGFVLFFDAPADAEQVAVLVETELAVQGVWGTAHRANDSPAWWRDAQPHAIAAPIAFANTLSSIVTIAVQPQEAAQ